MSTSITGVRFAPGVSAFSAARLLRQHLAPVAVRLDLGDIISDVVRAVDDADARGADRPQEPWRDALSRFRARSRKGGDSGHWCHAWIGDDPRDAAGRVYVLFNAASEFTAAAEAIDGVTEFSYSNASDWKPAGVSRAAYAARAKVWDRVLPGGVVSRSMLQVHVRDPHDLPVLNAVRDRATHPVPLLDAAPSRASRAHDVAFGVLMRACQAADPDASVIDLAGRLFFGQPRHVRRAVAAALDPDLPAALTGDDLDRSPVLDLTEAQVLAAQWVADGMPEDPIDETED